MVNGLEKTKKKTTKLLKKLVRVDSAKYLKWKTKMILTKSKNISEFLSFLKFIQSHLILRLALKILHSNNTEVNSNEIKIMRQIDNEYLITFYGHFYYQSNLCILMEFSEVNTKY